ncbi:MAG: 4-alpha-glucanotransferase [Candidatus Erginobacter occultus]|nr:4-alpha-glucanotransferase [Candidatus Erginobacter occultus]
MIFPRRSGILLHPTSLPSPGGIGDLGEEAYRFVDFLAASGQRLWQVLPLSPLGFGNSPYSSPAVLAGNPLLISPGELVRDGLLSAGELSSSPGFSPGRADYGRAAEFKSRLLKKAYQNFLADAGSRERRHLENYCREKAQWLEDVALYSALKDRFRGKPWTSWPEEFASRRPAALRKAAEELSTVISELRFYQYLFSRQWRRLRRYANDRGIEIIGDISFFANHDSVDVWAHRGFFLLDERGRPRELSGVPPSRFGVSQIWDMPLYDWPAMADAGFPWWRLRFSEMLAAFDIVRVDHFSGFYACWHVRPGARTSAEGRWVSGSGTALFKSLEANRGPLPIIAEALEPKIMARTELMLEELGYPGIRILQHGFSGRPGNPHLPANYPINCAAYPGTHDDDTARGWFSSRPRADRDRVRARLGARKGREVNWWFIEAVQQSPAATAIIPLQDVLSLGSEARMNTPGAGSGQWEWRFRSEMISSPIAEQLARATRDSGR